MAQTDWRLFLRDASVVRVETKKKKKAAVESETDVAVKKKKKRKTSPGVMRLLGIGEQRIVRGVAKAAGDYAKRSKKSAASKDGAVRGILKNVVKAQEGAIGQIAKIPRDLTKARELKRGSKRLGKSLRRLAW
jgi:hypothetical protein